MSGKKFHSCLTPFWKTAEHDSTGVKGIFISNSQFRKINQVFPAFMKTGDYLNAQAFS